MRSAAPVRRPAVILALALALGGFAAAPAPAVPATEPPAATAATAGGAAATTSGTVTWGFKKSWRSYVVKQLGSTAKLPAGKRIVLTKPATFAGASSAATTGDPETRAYRFPVQKASGTTSNLRVRTGGAVSYRVGGHFDIRLADVEVVVRKGKVSVVADVRTIAETSFGSISPGRKTTKNVVLATAPTSRTTAASGRTTVKVTGLTLTAAGSKALGGMYPAGTELDPLTATVTSRARVTQTLARTTIARTAKPKVAVKVASTGLTATGKVTVAATRGARTVTRTATLRSGKATVTLPKLAKGTWKIRTTYKGTTTVAKAASTKATLKVR